MIPPVSYSRGQERDKQYFNLILTAQHVIVGIVSDGIDVRWSLGATFAFVSSHYKGRVDGKQFIWVHGHTEQSRVRLP